VIKREGNIEKIDEIDIRNNNFDEKSKKKPKARLSDIDVSKIAFQIIINEDTSQ
jgi:hypothetical protein